MKRLARNSLEGGKRKEFKLRREEEVTKPGKRDKRDVWAAALTTEEHL